MVCASQEPKRVSTRAIIRAMGYRSLTQQRERMEAEVLAYMFEAADEGTFADVLKTLQSASFGAQCFANPVHAGLFNAAIELISETSGINEESLLNRIPESHRDEAGVTLCAIAAFEVASPEAFKRYLAELQEPIEHDAK